MKPVTDPAILAQLNAGKQAPRPVTDPAILAQLNSGGAPVDDPLPGVLDRAQPSGLPLGGIMDFVSRQVPLLARDVADTGQGFLEMGINAAPLPALVNRIGRSAEAYGESRNAGDGVLDAVLAAAQAPHQPIAAPNLSDAIGLPVADDGLESATHAGVRGLVGALTTGGAGSLPALAGGVTGGVSGDVTRQAGGGPVAQLIASLAGGMAPQAVTGAAGGLPDLLRRTLTDPKATAGKLDEFATAGVQPNAVQALARPGADPAKPSGVAGAVDWLARRTPGSAGVMADDVSGQGQQIGAKVDTMARQLTPEPTPEAAGAAISSGFDKFVSSAKSTASKMYANVDKLIPQDKPLTVRRTMDVLAKDAGEILPDSTLGKVMSNITAQADSAGALPYAAIKELRTRIGKMISDHNYISERPQLDRLYGALSEDVGEMAAGIPAGKVALDRANAFWRDRVVKPIDEAQHVVNKAGGPEKIFNAAMSGTKDGATTLRSLMASVGKKSPEAQKALAGTVLSRMGKAAPNAGEESAVGFTIDRFVKDFDTLSPAAREVLFKPMGEKFGKDLATVVRVAREVKAAAGRSSSSGSNAMRGMRNLSFGATALGVLGGLPAVAGAAGVAGASRGLASKLLTNPKFVSWLATGSNKPSGALPAAAGALMAQNPEDDDIREFAEAVGAPSAPGSPPQTKVNTNKPQPREMKVYDFGMEDNPPAGG